MPNNVSGAGLDGGVVAAGSPQRGHHRRRNACGGVQMSDTKVGSLGREIGIRDQPARRPTGNLKEAEAARGADALKVDGAVGRLVAAITRSTISRKASNSGASGDSVQEARARPRRRTSLGGLSNSHAPNHSTLPPKSTASALYTGPCRYSSSLVGTLAG